jgi:hypothetical protein
MYNEESCPSVADCAFSGNTAGFGGGMNNRQSSPTVTYCMFSDNYADRNGGGMYNKDSNPTVIDCVITGNSARQGGGLSNAASSPTLIDCRITGNIVESFCPALCGGEGCVFGTGGAMFNTFDSAPLVLNCVIATNAAFPYSCFADCCLFFPPCCPGGTWLQFESGVGGVSGGGTFIGCTVVGNGGLSTSPMIDAGGIAGSATVVNSVLWWNFPGQVSDTATVSYSLIQDGWPGTGNIDADPMFVDPANGGFRLSPASPCIDAGNNTAVPDGIDTDLDGNPRFVDDPDTVDTGYGDPPVVDMGAYEFQPCPWDLNGDGTVNVVDLFQLIASFGPCDDCPADFDDDGFVNAVDLFALIGHFGPCPGTPCVWDVTSDNVVNQADLQQVLDNMGMCGDCPEDVNGDGVVNGQDAAAVAQHFGACP